MLVRSSRTQARLGSSRRIAGPGALIEGAGAPSSSLYAAVMNGPFLALLLRRRLPVFYGWIVLACLCAAGFARQGPAVATLSIFVEPLTREFGWARTAPPR